MWDVVITRLIHHAVPAGMRWGQSRTTQLQPVLVCCARLHCVPSMFCCLLLDFLFFPQLSCFPLCVFFSSAHFSSVADFSSFVFFCCLFLNLLLKLSPNDLLHFFEKTSQLAEHVLFLFVPLSLKLPPLFFFFFCAINCDLFCSRCAAACEAVVPDFFNPHLNHTLQM